MVKDYDRTLPEIPAYPGELNQVWTNLIDNAVSAMRGAGTLTVSTSRDREYLVVEIGDTGPGVPAGDPGTGSSSRSSRPSRSAREPGLGLDISWRIVVNTHHGDLQVESRARRHAVPGPAAADRARRG